jgi:hypothetical protein
MEPQKIKTQKFIRVKLQMGIDDQLSRPNEIGKGRKNVRFARKAEWTGLHWQELPMRPRRED